MYLDPLAVRTGNSEPKTLNSIFSNDSVALAAALVASRGQGHLDPNNAYDEWGHTPLHYAAALGRPDMCR